MLSMRDVIDYCDLDQGEIGAVAEHEHVPMAIAAELGELLVQTPEGVLTLHRMIIENMNKAMDAGRFDHANELCEVYKHLCRMHPLPSSYSAQPAGDSPAK
ncbi:MAG: hypothetical protein RIR18_455 [Pseudomonadota bacterium]